MPTVGLCPVRGGPFAFVSVPEPARPLKVVIFCQIRDCLSGAKYGRVVLPGSTKHLVNLQAPYWA